MMTSSKNIYRKRPLWWSLLLGILAPICSLTFYHLATISFYLIQQYVNDHHQVYARYTYIILSGFLYSSLVWAVLIPLWMWWKLLGSKRLNWWHWSFWLISLLFTSPVLAYFSFMAYHETEAIPLIISHRGLDGHQAVENTIEALQTVSKSKPDYVEIDVFETADLEFVVFHDATLEKVGSKKTPHDLTLAELTQLTLTDPEHGHSGKIPSLDAILAEAKRLNQKLLIDFKTSKKDSPNMSETFLNKYQTQMEEQGHQLQASDVPFMRQVLSYKPAFETFLIAESPLEVEIPGLTGYSVQLLVMTEDIYRHIIEKGISIYVWTVNESGGVSEAEYLAVDGIITDFVSNTKQDLEAIKTYRNYTWLFYERLHSIHQLGFP